MAHFIEDALQTHHRLMQVSKKYAWQKSLYSVASFLDQANIRLYKSQNNRLLSLLPEQAQEKAKFTISTIINFIQSQREMIYKKLLLPEQGKFKFLNHMSQKLKQSDYRLLRHLLKKRYITQAPLLSQGIEGLDNPTSIHAVNGWGTLIMTGDFVGNVGLTPKNASSDEIAHSRVFALVHELGHAQMETVKNIFKPSVSFGKGDKFDQRMVPCLQNWVFSSSMMTTSIPYKQLSEAYADAYAVLVLRKEYPQFDKFLDYVYKARQTHNEKSTSTPSNVYLACPHAVRLAREVDVSTLSPQDLVEQASLVASNAWIETVKSCEEKDNTVLTGEKTKTPHASSPLKRLEKLAKSLLNDFPMDQRATRVVMEYVLGGEEEINKRKELAKGHVAEKAIHALDDALLEHLKPLMKGKLSPQNIEQALARGDGVPLVRAIDLLFNPQENTSFYNVNQNSEKEQPLFASSSIEKHPKPPQPFTLTWYDVLKKHSPNELRRFENDMMFMSKATQVNALNQLDPSETNQINQAPQAQPSQDMQAPSFGPPFSVPRLNKNALSSFKQKKQEGPLSPFPNPSQTALFDKPQRLKH